MLLSEAVLKTCSIRANSLLKLISKITGLNIINFHYNDEYIFKLACTYNSFELAKFVYSLKDFDKTKFDFDFFFNTILICNLDFIKWLYLHREALKPYLKQPTIHYHVFFIKGIFF